jgi:CysZ protein
VTSRSPAYNPHAKNALYHFGWGVRFFFSGLAMIVRHPVLLSLSLVPIVATAGCVLVLAVGAGWALGILLGDWLDAEFRLLLQAIVFALAMLAAYFFYLPLARVVLAPLAEALSRKTHALSTGTNYRSESNAWRAVREGVKLALVHLLIAFAVIGAGALFPPLGAPAGIAVAIFLCSLDLFDIPLAARGLPLGKKLRTIFANKALALGFGTAAYLMLLIPGLNLLSLPVGVVGATLLTDRLEIEG